MAPAFDDDLLKSIFFQQRPEAKTRVARVVVGLLMLGPEKGRGDEQLPARAQHAEKLGKNLVVMKQMLEYLRGNHGIETCIREIERVAVIVNVGLAVVMAMPADPDIDADIVPADEKLLIGLAAATKVENVALQFRRFLPQDGP